MVFSNEDIRRFRDEHYEIIKDMSADEIIERTRKAAAPGWELLRQLKEADQARKPQNQRGFNEH